MLSLMRLTFVSLNVVCKNWNFLKNIRLNSLIFLWFYVVLPILPPVLLFPLSFSSMEEKLRNTNVLVDSKLFDKLIFITLCLVEDQAF